MTHDQLLQALTHASASSATLDLGRTKVFVVETDEHLSDEAIGSGRKRTLVVLETPPVEPVVPATSEQVKLHLAQLEALAALVTRWQQLARTSPARKTRPGPIYARVAKELEVALLKR